MSNQTSLKPIVPLKIRQQIKQFGDTLKNRVIADEQFVYEIAFMEMEFNSSRSEYNGFKSWSEHAMEGTLYNGILMEKSVKYATDPTWIKNHKPNMKHVKRVDLPDYIRRRLIYNDWDQEVETEVLADAENEHKFEVSNNQSTGNDFIDSIVKKNKIKEEADSYDAQRKYNQIWIDDEEFVIKSFYSKSVVEAIKALPQRKYNSDTKQWTVPINFVNEIKEFALQYNFVFHKETSEYLFASKEKIDESYKTSADLDVDFLKLEPYPYQKAGIHFGVKRKKVLIADEMGLGKTIQSIGIVCHEDAFPCIVIAPKSLLTNWRNEWEKFTIHKAFVYHNTTADVKRILTYAEIIVVNYEGVKKLLPYKDLFKSIIVDESHYVKSKVTQRYSHVFNMAEGKTIRCLLTGTPIMNRPAELIPQLKILGALKDPLAESKFKSRYCGKDGKNAENLEELNIKLRTTVMIRREKKDVLTELPDFTRNYIDVEIETAQEYKMAEDNFITYLKEVRKMSHQKIRAAMNAEILVRMGILKQISARGKINVIKEFGDNCIEQGQKIILFCHHREVISAFAQAFETNLVITGDTKVEERQNIVDKFQQDPKEKVIVLSMRAASVGLTLTAASIEIFAEFDWTPAIHDQAEARAHRIGQKDHVNAYYFKGVNTIDEDIITLIENKREIANRATGSNTEINENKTIINELLAKRYNFTEAELESEQSEVSQG